jgi:hypothetical protein
VEHRRRCVFDLQYWWLQSSSHEAVLLIIFPTRLGLRMLCFVLLACIHWAEPRKMSPLPRDSKEIAQRREVDRWGGPFEKFIRKTDILQVRVFSN